MSARGTQWLGRRYLLRVGRFKVSSYAVALYIGFAVGVVFGAHECGINPGRFGACSLILLVPALIGGRLWWLVQHPRTARRAGLRVSYQAGGAGLYGGLVLSFLVSLPVLRVAHLDFWRFWDGAAVVLLVGMVITRLGCLITGCCAGRPTQGPLGVRLPDSSGAWARRYPAQLLEAAWSAAILAVASALYTPADHAGVLFFGAAAAYGLGRVGLESLRADAAMSTLATRMNVGFSAALALVSATSLVMRLH